MDERAISNALKAMDSQAGLALFERNSRLFSTAEALALHNESETILRCTPTSKAACVICGNAAQGIMVAHSFRRGPSDFLVADRKAGCSSTSAQAYRRKLLRSDV